VEEDQHQAREATETRIDRTLDGEDTTARERGIVGRNRIRVQKREAEEGGVMQDLANLLLYWIESEVEEARAEREEEEDRQEPRDTREVMSNLSPALACIASLIRMLQLIYSLSSHIGRDRGRYGGERASVVEPLKNETSNFRDSKDPQEKTYRQRIQGEERTK